MALYLGNEKIAGSGSAASITPENIGAAPIEHTHDDRYYTENETLSSAVKLLLGLSEENTPNDAFSMLATSLSGGSTIYTWSKSIQRITFSEDVHSLILYYGDIKCSDTVILVDGVYILVNPYFITINRGSDVATLNSLFAEKYIELNGTVYKFKTFSNIAAMDVSADVYYQTTVTETSTVQSPERNTYPDSGTDLDGYTYTYLGEFEQASIPKMETGTYTGTGVYGSSNPNSLTFDFEPKIVIIQHKSGDGLYINDILFINGVSSRRITSSKYQYITWNGKTVTWYSTDISYQFNDSGVTYYYIAIG